MAHVLPQSPEGPPRLVRVQLGSRQFLVRDLRSSSAAVRMGQLPAGPRHFAGSLQVVALSMP